jgi:hypothetical protein
VGVSGWHKVKAFSLAALLIAGSVVPAAAAELKISLSELARILTATLGQPKLRLHNVPGGLINLTPGSSLTLGNTSVPLPIPARTFQVGGSTYAYYINELNSKAITVSAVPSALRFTMTFENTGPEVIGRCLSGFCVSDSSLPEIQWNSPVVQIDLTPVWINGNLSLNAKRVDIGGTFSPDCDMATGIFSGSLCRVVLPQARKATATIKTDLNKVLLEQINAPDIQAKLASGLRSYLKFGPVGEVRFSKVTVDADFVTLTFCLACQPS